MKLKKLITKNILIKISLFILVFVLGISFGVFLDRYKNNDSLNTVREESANYKFINPLLFTTTSEDQAFPEYLPLKKSLIEYTDKAEDKNKISNISIYFRNLNSSQWISINPDETFSPSSMLKVLTLISVLRVAETDPSFLSNQILIEGDDNRLVKSQVRYPAKNPVRSGQTYSIDELTKHLILESDNVANVALSNLIGEEKIKKTYSDLKLPQPSAANTKQYTTEEYSHLFRALYNGTYLSRWLSEHVLELLSQTSFDQGIVAGVPKDTMVSHKFGVNNNPLTEQKELHDCGIVYYPEKPYFICIMTRGNDFENLENILKDISEITWSYVDNPRNK